MLQKTLLPLALLGLGAIGLTSLRAPDGIPGSVAPNFSIAQWYGYEGGDSIESLQGKVVLLDFWRTW